MANYNIGPKIGIEGEKEFRAQISRINKEYSSMESYTKAVSTAMAQQGKSQELLASKSNGLRQQLNLQQQKFRDLSEALEKAKASYGENSQEVLRFEGAILDVKNTTAALQRELDATDDELRRMAAGIKDVGDAAEVADDKVLSFGDMLKAGIASGAILNGLERAGELIVEIGGQSIEAAAEVKAANAQFSQTFGDLETTATSALRSISEETGIAVTRLQGGYTALYAFTKSVGGDQDTALNIAQRALTAAADSAAYYDRTMEDATETLQSFLKGNYENDAALGIAATETTRNAKANELYAKSFKELTEAQKVDTLLAMVEAGNAASGALGQAAREADSWANVTGELTEAWKQFLARLGGPVLQGLTPLIRNATKALKSFTQETSFQKLSREIGSFQTSMENAQAALDDSNVSMQATAGLAGQYVRRLEEIEAAGLDTADAQRDYAQTVELLNTLMPELGLTINQTTGRLNQNTDSIYANIDSLKAQAQEQAKQAYYKTILDEQSAAYEALFAAEMRQKELLAEQAVLIDKGAKAYDTLTYTQTGSLHSMVSFNSTLTEEDRRLAAVNRELTVLSGEIKQANGIIASADEEFKAATVTLGSYGKTSNQTTAVTQQQAASQKALATAFATAKAAARESIDSQIGLFDKLATKNEYSAKSIIANWEKQKKAFTNYSANLQKAVDLGLDESLIKQLSDGSQQSMQILDAIVNDSKISVDEINAAFKGVSKSKDELSGTMADIHDIVIDSLEDTAKDAQSAGKDIVDGAIRGIKTNKSRFAATMTDLAKGGQSAYNHTWERHSPSRWMRDASDDIADGGILQIKRRIPDMRRVMSELATAGQVGYQDQLDALAAYPSMMAGTPGYGGTTSTSTRNVSYGGISININAQPGQDARSIADEVIDVLTLQLGREEAAFG